MMQMTRVVLAGLAAATVVAGCASGGMSQDLDAEFAAMMKSSFRDEGIAKTDRLQQDLAQAACSSAKPPAPEVAKRIEAEAMATIKWPTGGQYFGNWAAGEKLAQSGVGMAWNNETTDPSTNGGQCYNCHEISKQEISFGTIGPSLYHYGKNRGVKDVAAPESAPVVQYTWSKLWNSKAHVACSNMPRFGHMHLLNETQIRDLMSLLLDPRSPVNQ